MSTRIRKKIPRDVWMVFATLKCFFTWNVNWKKPLSIYCVCRLSITWGDKMGLYFCLDLSKLTNFLLLVIVIGRVMKYTKKMNRWKKPFLTKNRLTPFHSSQKLLILTKMQIDNRKSLFCHIFFDISSFAP